ncbi:ATP-binding cassette domain-containing protein [Aeropyrum camini]|uniref:ATP-binding cassette domain-containing protein n=1 Tax=Aeropyrum camini TaxID=229980 RepID=UPI000A70F852|nr:ATP-binding cassette domain-containing protein [Aeropyrum camini]
MGLEGKEGRYPEELSGGEQQRLAVAVALANDPPIIVADEPTGELDIATGERIVRILLEEAHGRGKTVVLTTHDPRVARMADRVAVLEDGRLRGIYSPQRIAGGAGLGEVEAEKAVEAALRKMMEEARLKLREAEERFRRGEIGIDELINIYTRSRALEEAVREELSRLGVTA